MSDPKPAHLTPSSSAETLVIAHCDGGSRGNPGPAGFGAVLEDASGRLLARLSEYLGKRTNNYAEYSALLAVLAWTLENGYRRLRVVADSELMVRQMQGRYKVKSPDLRPLWEEAQRRVRQLDHFEMQHTLRGGNKLADQLANEAMDRGMGRGPEQVSTRGMGRSASPEQAENRMAADSGANVRTQPTPAARAVSAEPASAIGFVKNGVVHFVEGSLPEGVFVRITRQ
jgi:probable phosphoglycerate mutase